MDADTKRIASLIESALADMAGAAGDSALALGLIETALATAIERLEQRGVIDPNTLLKAIAEARPVVHVHVPAAPAPVVHLPGPAEFVVTRPGLSGQSDVVLMRIKRVA